MNDMELAEILRGMYNNARRNEAVCQVNLFGILYAEELKNSGCTIKHIVELAGIQSGYVSEISKGMKLSRYVVPRGDQE